MKTLVYGSINIDMTYHIDHIVREGETITATSFSMGAGGKGANQAAALAKAGADVFLAGRTGSDACFIMDKLKGFKVDTSLVKVDEGPRSGKALIQVDKAGRNSIIVLPAANREQSDDDITHALGVFSKGDWLVLQNEVNGLAGLISMAKAKGMHVCINPSPLDEMIKELPLQDCDMIFVNEEEGAMLAGKGLGATTDEVIGALKAEYPGQVVILTLGKKGACHISREGVFFQDIIDYPVVDTTGAGDSFLGFYLASHQRGLAVEDCLYYASKASGIAVSRPGAMDAMPFREEVFPKD